ncbi:hypothetical protein PJP10_32545, partial [Mycobacterium kansasii]
MKQGNLVQLPEKSKQAHGKDKAPSPRKIVTKWVVKNKNTCLVIHSDLNTSSGSKWYLDSGCSRHMIG